MSSPGAAGRRPSPGVLHSPGQEVRHGRKDVPADMRQFGGYFSFESPDADLLVKLLPQVIHIRGTERLTGLVRLIGDEAGRDDVGRDLILERLVEVLLIEGLRSVPGATSRPGLLPGLSDDRVVAALRLMHGDLKRNWTANVLARDIGMSRSAFFDRFLRTVGMTPMDYLLAWRMAVAKSLLRAGGSSIADIADRVGYGSASTFSTAFSRHVGEPPGRYMQRSLDAEKSAKVGAY